MAKVLKIGIASREDMKARTLAIARGELKPGAVDPKVWFSSIEIAGADSIDEESTAPGDHPHGETFVAQGTRAPVGQRGKQSFAHAHTMERYGLVELRKSARGTLVPSVPYERYQVECSLPKAA